MCPVGDRLRVLPPLRETDVVVRPPVDPADWTDRELREGGRLLGVIILAGMFTGSTEPSGMEAFFGVEAEGADRLSSSFFSSGEPGFPFIVSFCACSPFFTVDWATAVAIVVCEEGLRGKHKQGRKKEIRREKASFKTLVDIEVGRYLLETKRNSRSIFCARNLAFLAFGYCAIKRIFYFYGDFLLRGSLEV